jgi:hypothetical protein
VGSSPVTPVSPRNSESGRGDWIRTSDPLRPRQVRYQAALRPDSHEPKCTAVSPSRQCVGYFLDRNGRRRFNAGVFDRMIQIRQRLAPVGNFIVQRRLAHASRSGTVLTQQIFVQPQNVPQPIATSRMTRRSTHSGIRSCCCPDDGQAGLGECGCRPTASIAPPRITAASLRPDRAAVR